MFKKANLIAANVEQASFIGARLDLANIYLANFEVAETLATVMPDSCINDPENYTIIIGEEKQTVMTRKIIKTENAPNPVGPYNQAVMVNNMIFLSGQVAIDPRINQIVHLDDVAKQTEQVMSNLQAVLTEAGATWENVVKTTIFLKDMNDFTQVNEVYSQYFNPETAPARATVEVSRLPKDVLVEIECIAVL